MVDINLHQAAEKDLTISRQKSFFNSTYFISLILLVVVGLAYGATMLYRDSLIAKDGELIAAKDQEIKSIDAAEVNKLSDFQNRIISTNFNLENKRNPEDILQMVERLVVKGSFLNSLNYNSIDNKIEMEVVADSFRLAANQILSLKKSELFNNVSIVDSNRNKDGQAVFKLEASFK
ncbi:MAG: PilN domain-containing protein [Parcubacteria group bacterium]|jgi:hypothetical protein